MSRFIGRLGTYQTCQLKKGCIRIVVFKTKNQASAYKNQAKAC